LTDTLAPLLQKIEEEFNRKLFDDLNAGINFDENALLRADKTSQADYYTKLINAGIITPSEARRELGYNYREESDKLFMQTNMSSMDNIANNNTIITQKKDEQNGTPAGTDGVTVNTV
jgi:phage portal protein BeeE